MGKPALAAPVPASSAAAPAAPALPALIRPDARVGLFGGSFDPVHLGHLALARAALDALGLDHLFFIPAAHAPLRDTSPAATAADRLDLLRLALADAAEPRFGLLDVEVRSGQVRYTIDTVRSLHAAWPRARLFWILGADQLAQFDRWREPAALAGLVELAVLARDGQTPAAPASLAPLLRLHTLSAPAHPASSAEIRRLRHAGQPWRLWLPPAVAAAIEKRGLYL